MERAPSGPCHVPASAPRSRRQIRGRCAGGRAGGLRLLSLGEKKKKKKRKDDASAGRQKPKRSGRWPSPSHQTGTNEEAGPQSQQARHKRGDIKSERASAFVRPTIRSEERCQCHHLPVEAALHSALLLKGRPVCGNMTGGGGSAFQLHWLEIWTCSADDPNIRT